MSSRSTNSIPSLDICVNHTYVVLMTDMLKTRLEITSWVEETVHEMADGSKITRASVSLSGDGDALSAATFDAVMFYRPDGTSSYVSIMQVTGALQGREGGFVLQGDGTFDGTTASGRSTVVGGSGSGKLAGLTGTARSDSTHDDYPFMPLTLDYDFG
jgi:Protein of unknown function (DUF3224)